jgi:hypothetical protein
MARARCLLFGLLAATAACSHVRAPAPAPPGTLVTIALHFETPSRLEEFVTKARKDRVEVEVLDAARSIALVKPGALLPPENPFDAALALAASSGAERAEPLLDVELPWNAALSAPGSAWLGGLGCGCGKTTNDQWSLKQIVAEDGWEKAQNDAGKVAGREAAGVLVGHLDTGYTKHPEVWDAVGGPRPVDPARGVNYIELGQAPVDPVPPSSGTDNPGHGTQSSSVIVSPEGCQLANQCGCVTGIGRGAQTAPYRVNESVILFQAANFVHALRDVAEAPVPPQLISMAMGGYPTYTMWKQLNRIEDRGIPAVAAAGNVVQFVVWPARFRSTIAVAATTVHCRRWAGSSHGPAIDIAAPGKQVWRAGAERKQSADPVDFFNGRGDGTTYATGQTSGATALWLAFHGGHPHLPGLVAGGTLTVALRQLLEDSAWKPNHDPHPPETHCLPLLGWPPSMGPGILHVEALLEQSLPDPATVQRPARLALTQLPLFATLLPPDTPNLAVRTEEIYRRLLGVSP